MPIIGSGQMTLIDMNDVLVSATKPSNPAEGQMWWNTTESQLYIYQGGTWQPSTFVISGGRNLLRNSGLFKSTTGWTLNGGTGLVVEKKDGESCLSATGSVKAVASVPVKNGQEYIYATEIMFDTDIALNSSSPLHYWVNLTGVNGTAGLERVSVDGGDRTLVANKWHRIVIRFKVKDDGNSYVFTPFIYKSPMTQKWWMKTIQLMEGNVPTGWSPAPEEVDEIITDVTETLGNMANDNLIEYNERKVIKEKLEELIGVATTDTGTLPAISTLDTSNKGLIFTVRQQARQVGIPIGTNANPSAGHPKYYAVQTTYETLKTYLEGLKTTDNISLRPWDVSTGNQKKVISVVKLTFRTNWLNFYNALNDLATYTSQVQNDDAYNPVRVNHASNGNFEIPLVEGLWKNSYVGQTKEIVDISTETAPFQFAYHVKNTTNANGGIFTQELWSGANAEALVDREVTIQFWLKYQNIVAGAQVYLAGRFGELLIEGENASAQKFYRYIRFANTTTMNEGSYITGTDMTWKKYTGTTKLTMPTGATKITRVSFKHGLEGCTGEFWTTGIKIEFGAKASDWSVAPIDLQQKVYKTALAVEPDNITATVTSNQTFMNAIDKVVSNETGYINKNYNFAEWTGTYPKGYNGHVGTAPVKVTPSETGNGKSVRFVNALGVESYLSGDGYLDKPYYNYVYVESTFKLESGSINGAGILFRYLRADNATSAFEGRFKFSDVVASPTLNKWYTVSTVFKVPAPVDFGGYRLYTMGSYGGFDATKPAKSILIDSTISRPATAEEAKAYEANISINDMTNDNKLTALEKHDMKNQLDMIVAEKPTYESKANQYFVVAEKNAYVTAYNSLYDTVNPLLAGANLNLTSDVNGANIRTLFKNYNDKKTILEKAILDALNFGGRNVVFNSKFKVDDNGSLFNWTSVASQSVIKDPEADKPDSNIWSISRTGQATNSILSAYSNKFKASMDDSFVFAIDLKVANVTAWDVQNPFIVEFFDSTGTRVQFEDITLTRLGSPTIVNNTWYRLWCVAKVTNANVVSGGIRLSLFRNGDISIREVKVEKGTKPTEFTVAPEDVDSMIYNIETRMSSAEIKISDSSIINTIRQSTDYKNDLSGKANSSDLANLATKGEVDNANQDAKSYADEKVNKINFEPFVLKTQLSQEITNVTAKFEAGGGVNLLKNSTGYGVLTATPQDSYVPAWTLVNPTGVQSVSSSALDALGFGRGFQLPPSTVTTQMTQDVYVQVGQPYTFSWYINKSNNSSSANTDGAVYVDFLHGATVLNSAEYTTTYASNYVTNGFEKGVKTIIPTAGVLTVRIRANKLSDVILGGLMFNIGSTALQWSLATGELYNTNIRMDMNGIKVSQIVNGVERGYTQITPQEFAGYYDSKGDGKYEKVFYLKEDETVSKKFVAKEEFTLGSIKIIKVESSANKGWAFVQVVPTT